MKLFKTGRTIEQALGSSRQNNFDILRFIAAGLVIISHSFALAGGYIEPALGSSTLGTIGVYIFFIMSGFLVAKSWDLHPRVAAFIGKRMLRILPGLAAATLFVMLVVGPVFTSVPVKDYLSHPQTIAYLGNVGLFSLNYNLPGVFEHNSFASNANGSLWTLPYEFVAYIFLALAGTIGLLKRRFNLIFSVAGLIGLMYLFIFIFSSTEQKVLDLQLNYIPRMFAYFGIGVIAYQHRRSIVLHELPAILAFVAVACSPWLPGQFCIRLIAMSYLVLYLALAKSKYAHSFARYGDISYGMYIYAWPVQQAVFVITHGNIGPLRMAAYSFPIIMVLAALSWHFVEKPFLKMKHLFSAERYPVLPSHKKSEYSR